MSKAKAKAEEFVEENITKRKFCGSFNFKLIVSIKEAHKVD